MELITCNEELTAHVPNSIQPAPGEENLFDKIFPYIQTAEEWIAGNICDPKATHARSLRHLLREICACEALYSAFAMLDLVMTPNGMGVVNTETISPASEARSKTARESLLLQRDRALNLAISKLRKSPEWRGSECGRWWGATLMCSLEDAGDNPPSFAKYLEKRPHFEKAERMLADEYVGDELMEALRSEFQAGVHDSPRMKVARCLRQQVADFAEFGAYDEKMMLRCVNFIRNRPAVFPEWTQSDAARNFDLPGFRNSPNSPGFFF